MNIDFEIEIDIQKSDNCAGSLLCNGTELRYPGWDMVDLAHECARILVSN